MQKFIVSLVTGIALALSNYYFSEDPAHSYKVRDKTIEQKQAQKDK
ncbi:hypothetical protein [Sphingobacterium deserti]|nr:hypothetical protein [Sphingobacterium deserti]